MRSVIFILLLVWVSILTANAQLFHRNKECENEALKNGKHYEYWDADSIRLSAKGHFCSGKPCKTWKYYHSDGTRRMKVKYRDMLKIKQYAISGKLSQKGYAVLDFNTEDVHFYWHGVWKYYDDKRKLYRIARYENGEEVQILFGPEEPVYYE